MKRASMTRKEFAANPAKGMELARKLGYLIITDEAGKERGRISVAPPLKRGV